MNDQFNGFDADFWHFFHDLKQNNTREWFADNKTRYQEKVVAPVSAFISAIAPRLRDISPHYNADPRPNKGSMFRIYRDVRFSKDKKPYKEHAAAQFRHRMGKDAHAPGFYVHLEADNILYGGGIWTPPSDALRQIRDRIVSKPEKWQAVIEDKALLEQFGGIRGDSLKRPPRDFSADAPHMTDLKRKSFFAMKTLQKSDIVGTAAFVDEVINSFEAAVPLMYFISDAVNVEF
ncbi:MAG: TIGR02453 family protein [Alphaproteobacteria bacterium]|nr:MAG: TIGR02453 family protein [Alphaproteobacteria bacterium]